MSRARGNRSRRAEGTTGEQSAIDRLTNIVAWLLEKKIKRDEHAQAINNAKSEFRRLNPPIFEGGVDPIAADQWLQTMERMTEVAKVIEEEKVTCSFFMLRGAAEYWVEFKEESLFIYNKDGYLCNTPARTPRANLTTTYIWI